MQETRLDIKRERGMKKQKVLANTATELTPYSQIEERLMELRGVPVLLDADVALVYGVETRAVNQAVRRNPDKFPAGYLFELTNEETADLRSQSVTANDSLRSQIVTLDDSLRSQFATLKESESARGKHSKHGYKAFTEKGLYMLATILKSAQATAATLAIIETFAKVRSLKRELVELHKETDKPTQMRKLKHFGETLVDVVMPEMEAVETESSLELNFIIGKIKHTVRRIKRQPKKP